MKFDELDDDAKERARDKWRESCLHDEWWDCTYEDAVECAKALGIEIDIRYRTSRLGKQVSDGPDIRFEGFSHQGQGACFSGSLTLTGLEGAIQRVKDHASADEDLAAMAILAESIWQQATVKVVAQRLDHEHDENDADHLVMGNRLNIDGKDRYYRTSINNLDDSDVFLEDDLNNLVESFAQWIYGQLEAEHDYQHADETVDDNIKCNDMEFDEEGCLL